MKQKIWGFFFTCTVFIPVNTLPEWQIVAKVSAIYTSKHTARVADSGKGECYL